MALFVTGRFSFIVSWVVKRIVESGEDVVVYDIVEKDYDYLRPLQQKISFAQGDVLDYPHLSHSIRSQTDLRRIVYSVALLGGDMIDNPHRGITVNTMGVANVLAIARHLDRVRVVYVSNGAVYGTAPGPIDESAPLVSSDPYGATKVASEHFCAQHHAKLGVDTVSARLFLCYGPPEGPGPEAGFNTKLFYPLAGIPNPSHPHGLDQLADWTYVDDTARGIQLMLDADGLMDRAFNIATGVTIPVSEIMDAVLTHAPDVPDYNIGLGANLERGTPLDITCASTQLGYEPHYDIEAGSPPTDTGSPPGTTIDPSFTPLCPMPSALCSLCFLIFRR